MKSFIEMLQEAAKDPTMHTAQVEVGGKTKNKEVEPNKLAPSQKKADKEVLAKGRTITGDKPNQINLNPEYIIRADGIKEAALKTVVFSFGRMNPPTVGHEKLVDKIVSVAKANKADARLFLSRTEGDKKNPLPYSEKMKLAKMAFPGVVQETPAGMYPAGFIGLLKMLEDKYDKVIIVVGSDRLPNIKALATKYNGTEYKFQEIEVVSAGERDPDEEGVGGMSASKMRAAAVAGDLEAFKSGLPTRLKSAAKVVMSKLQSHLTEDLDEAVLTLSQRLKRRAQMRRAKGKIRMGQKRALTRKASSKTISKRSKRIAIKLIRKRILRGRKYQDLSYSARAAVDRQVARRKKAIARIAKRIEPKLRQAEGRRKSGQGFKPVSLTAPTPKKLKEGLSIDNLIPMVTEMFSQIAKEVSLPMTILERNALMRKCNESNIPFSTLKAVYERGVASWYSGLREDSTPQQWGFARVNSFIAGGLNARTADRDLFEAKDEAGKHEKLAAISNKDTTSKQLVGFMKNNDQEIADAARQALEKRRNTGDKEAGSALDKHETSQPEQPEQEAPAIVSQKPKYTVDLAQKLAKIMGGKKIEEATKVHPGRNAGLGNEPTVNAKPVHHKASGHKYHLHHMINPNLGVTHQVKHAVDRKDLDVDGDTDQFDKPKAGIPDEMGVGTNKPTKKMFAKYGKEHAHIHAGEPVDEQTITPKYTGDENSWYLDASGQKVRVYSQSDLKHPEEVEQFLKNPTPEKDIAPMMSMKDFLRTQPEKKK